jgi:indole-3-glycerol phosphate synthase
MDIDTSRKLAPLIPAGVLKVAESGIANPETIVSLRKEGYRGFLMGENFMKHSRPEKAARLFIDKLKDIA